MAETKAANLRLESRAYSFLHYLSAIEGRSKAAIVEEALDDYAAAHPERLEKYARTIADIAGIRVPARAGAKRSRAEIIAAGRARSRGRNLVSV